MTKWIYWNYIPHDSDFLAWKFRGVSRYKYFYLWFACFRRRIELSSNLHGWLSSGNLTTSLLKWRLVGNKMWRIVNGRWLKNGRWWIKSSGCGCELNEERREMLRKEGIAEPSASIRSGASFVVSVHWQRTMQLQGCPSDSVLPQFVRSHRVCLCLVCGVLLLWIAAGNKILDRPNEWRECARVFTCN